MPKIEHLGLILLDSFEPIRIETQEVAAAMMMVREQIVGPMSEPAALTQHEQVLNMVLRSGSIEVGLRRTELRDFRYVAGEMILTRRHVEEWIRSNDLHVLSLTISDAALSTKRVAPEAYS